MTKRSTIRRRLASMSWTRRETPAPTSVPRSEAPRSVPRSAPLSTRLGTDRRGDLIRSRQPADEFVWIDPSPTSNPARPRTQAIGYNAAQGVVRTVFRDGTQWRYEGVSQQEWADLQRTGSPGKYINRVLNRKSYGPDHFDLPAR